MPFLDANALTTDPEGMDRLRACVSRRRPDEVRARVAAATTPTALAAGSCTPDPAGHEPTPVLAEAAEG